MNDRTSSDSDISAALHEAAASLTGPSLETGLIEAARQTRQRRRWLILATSQALVLEGVRPSGRTPCACSRSR